LDAATKRLAEDQSKSERLVIRLHD